MKKNANIKDMLTLVSSIAVLILFFLVVQSIVSNVKLLAITSVCLCLLPFNVLMLNSGKERKKVLLAFLFGISLIVGIFSYLHVPMLQKQILKGVVQGSVQQDDNYSYPKDIFVPDNKDDNTKSNIGQFVVIGILALPILITYYSFVAAYNSPNY